VIGSKHSFGEADQRSVWSRQYVTEPTFRLFECLTPLVLPNIHVWAGHERGVGIIPGHDVQSGQLGDVAGDGVAKRERFKGFLTCLQRTGVCASGGSPER
jgi:hypothetical protein